MDMRQVDPKQPLHRHLLIQLFRVADRRCMSNKNVSFQILGLRSINR